MSAVLSPPRARRAGLLARRAARAPRPLGRVLTGAATVFLLSSVLTFGLGAVSDANPAAAVLGETATPADIARLDHQFGLDRPLPVQYGSWLLHALGGDLGVSWFTTVPVADSIAAALPVDLSIAGLALLLAVLLGGAAGVSAALSNGGRLDRAVTAVCTLLGTLPAFVIAIGLITLVAVQFRLLPSGGYVPFSQNPGEWLRFALLPALALSLDAAAGIARQLRTSLVAELRENYATGALMRGLSWRRVLFGHALRNAAGPAVTVLGMSVPVLIGGAVVTERIFNLPGIAQLSLRAAEQHDVPVIQGTLLVTVAVVLAANLAVDALLFALNPAARRRARPAGAVTGTAAATAPRATTGAKAVHAAGPAADLVPSATAASGGAR
ncbi:ABC transporter permease [Kitasatospora sp. NPDC058201]|uniref:ABC transporter permease n=1 Tax=unclassified Kitasatospora TaxID=2633591 RepID=UPI003652885A